MFDPVVRDQGHLYRGQDCPAVGGSIGPDGSGPTEFGGERHANHGFRTVKGISGSSLA
jgi:hypothetical protein